MSRPRLELQPTYGKLTVVSDMGGTKTLVRCECGTQKWVLRTNLRAGRIHSCGKPGCRVYQSGASPATLATSSRAPSWIPTDAIPGLYARAQQTGEVAKLCEELQVSDTTIYKLLAAIRQYGGIDPYMAYLTGDQPAHAPAAPTRPAPAIKPGEMIAPPPKFDPSAR